MDWKYILTTLIAVYAVWVARGASKKAGVATKDAHDLQLRLEQYEYLPIIKVDVVPVGDRVKIRITNSSPKCAATSYTIRFILRIQVEGGAFSLEREGCVHQGGFIQPSAVEEISPEDINQTIADALPTLQRYSPDQYNFVLRAFVECAPPHPKAPTVIEEGVGFFIYEKGKLESRAAANILVGKVR